MARSRPPRRPSPAGVAGREADDDASAQALPPHAPRLGMATRSRRRHPSHDASPSEPDRQQDDHATSCLLPRLTHSIGDADPEHGDGARPAPAFLSSGIGKRLPGRAASLALTRVSPPCCGQHRDGHRDISVMPAKRCSPAPAMPFAGKRQLGTPKIRPRRSALSLAYNRDDPRKMNRKNQNTHLNTLKLFHEAFMQLSLPHKTTYLIRPSIIARIYISRLPSTVPNAPHLFK